MGRPHGSWAEAQPVTPANGQEGSTVEMAAAFPSREPACSIRNTKKNGPMVGAFGVNPDG